MSVIVKPWKNVPNQFHITVRFKWPDGSALRDRKVIDAKSPAMARKWGEARESELRRAGQAKPQEAPKPKAITVAEFAPDWLDKHARANLHKASGIDSQDSILRIHILPFIGGLGLDAVTDEVVADLKAKWIAGGYEYAGQGGRIVKTRATTERKTINNRLSVLGKMLRVAVEWRRISAMPFASKLLKVDRGRDAAFYEHDIYERLVEASAKVDPRHHAMILLGGDGGLRRGEITGLDLADVDFKGARMAIRRSVFWKKGVRYEDVAKEERPNGYRSLPGCLPRFERSATSRAHASSTRTKATS